MSKDMERPTTIEVGQRWEFKNSKPEHGGEYRFTVFEDAGESVRVRYEDSEGTVGLLSKTDHFAFGRYLGTTSPPSPQPVSRERGVCLGCNNKGAHDPANVELWDSPYCCKECRAKHAPPPEEAKPCEEPSTFAFQQAKHAATLPTLCRLGLSCTHHYPKKVEPYIPTVTDFDLLPDAGPTWGPRASGRGR